ncbi:hypothetical protein GE061_013047 [Apolygus lucorum]|uniref:DUF4794 domain-containing protein n=1 Tax=Apolygus lucorum TaxID=248454 RepID=A0A6A4JYR0_APOLU|nr:hypothetical protein GE061_013047 [Apolygus lucorum]
MKLAVFCILLVGCHALPAEVEKDNKAVESKNVKSVAPTSTSEGEKTNKNEKRAPVVQTVVPGELKYGNKIEYSSPAYSQQLIQSAPEVQQVKYISPDPKSPYYEPPQPAPKPQYLFYSPQSTAAASHVPAMAYPTQAQLILMLAVPHPSGRYMMLYPANNLLMPLFFGHPGLTHQASSGSVPVPGYQAAPSAVPTAYQSTSGAYQTYSGPLAQHAGFVAQHQLAYSPYRTEKYSPSKQQ